MNSTVAAQEIPSHPSYKLFDRISVLIASILGSPVAGAALMAINQSRWGEGKRAPKTVVIALLATSIVSVAAYLAHLDSLIPQYELIVAVTCAVIMSQIAQIWQGAAIERHRGAGGALVSRWAAAGVGLALLVAIIGGAVGFSLLSDDKVIVGSRDKVHYSGQATKADATKLGQTLKSMGYFSDRGVDVVLSKQPSETRVSFVVEDGAWNQPDGVAGFERVGLLVATDLGFPLHVVLMDRRQEPRKDLIVGRLMVGSHDVIYYFGSSTDSQARLVGSALSSAGYLQDRGVTVLLSQEDGDTSLSFPVLEGTWDKQEAADYFVPLARRCLPATGAVRIKLRLVNSNLEVKKELLVTAH